MRLQRLCGVVGVVLVLLTLPATAAGPEKYEAALSSMPFTEANRAAVKGRGRAAVVLDGAKLSITGTFAGLTSAATEAQLRVGLGIGVPGPVALPLAITQAESGTITAEVTLDAAQLAAVRRGRAYIQINSKAGPTGSLWGWILPQQPPVVRHEPVPGHGFLPQLDIPAQ